MKLNAEHNRKCNKFITLRRISQISNEYYLKNISQSDAKNQQRDQQANVQTY